MTVDKIYASCSTYYVVSYNKIAKAVGCTIATADYFERGG